MITRLYRPIATAITSKAPHSTPSQSAITFIPQNHVNDTSDNDVINKPIISTNRPLPATPMAGINTALTIGNSFQNAKFKSVESKLCGKIIAMKPYFIDELWSLKNETTINKEQDRNMNTEKTATLKNKIKLLELENKLLKTNKNFTFILLSTFTNKQKFTDTMIQHNSKLSQNFGVSRIIRATKETRKRPHEWHNIIPATKETREQPHEWHNIIPATKETRERPHEWHNTTTKKIPS